MMENIKRITITDFHRMETAARQAEKDGIKIIHDMEFDDENSAAYIDTTKNRELLKDLVV